MTDAEVNSRRDLRAYLTEAMPGSSLRFEEARKHRPGEGRAKAYLLDVHVPPADVHNQLAALFSNAATELEAVFTETRDSQFFRLVREGEILFLDAFDPRFVVAHTTGLAKTTDELIRALVESSASIDRAWLASPFLGAELPELGRAIRHVVHFDSIAFWSGAPRTKDRFWEDDDSGEQDPRRTLGKRMALDLSGGLAESPELVADLKQLPKWGEVFSLARVDVAKSLGDDDYIVERVFNWGKISGVGTNGEQHLLFIERLRAAYTQALLYIEDRLRLSVTSDGDGRSLSGHPISIEYSIDPRHLDLFVQRLFSGKRPFRLWGVPQRWGADYYTVQALDLHISRVIACEVFPTGMRIFLKEDSCANSIARIYTNLLSYVDAQAKIWGRGRSDALFHSGDPNAPL